MGDGAPLSNKPRSHFTSPHTSVEYPRASARAMKGAAAPAAAIWDALAGPNDTANPRARSSSPTLPATGMCATGRPCSGAVHRSW